METICTNSYFVIRCVPHPEYLFIVRHEGEVQRAVDQLLILGVSKSDVVIELHSQAILK